MCVIQYLSSSFYLEFQLLYYSTYIQLKRVFQVPCTKFLTWQQFVVEQIMTTTNTLQLSKNISKLKSQIILLFWNKSKPGIEIEPDKNQVS